VAEDSGDEDTPPDQTGTVATPGSRDGAEDPSRGAPDPAIDGVAMCECGSRDTPGVADPAKSTMSFTLGADAELEAATSEIRWAGINDFPSRTVSVAGACVGASKSKSGA
jgi:hypothetical protein